MAFTENDVDSIYETLQEPFEHLERRIVVSGMVQEAVARGFLKALEEDFQFQLHGKDEEIKDLKEKLAEKDTLISEIRTLLLEAQHAEGSDTSASQKCLDFLQTNEKKWQENEEEILKKEREIEKLASSLVEMASILEKEMQRAALLDSHLLEVKNQEISNIEQISSMQHEIGKLRVDNSRLKRQVRLKEHQFDQDMNHVKDELRKNQILLEKGIQENQALDISLRDKGKALSDLKNKYQELELQVESADERVQRLLMESDKLQEAIESQELMQELLIICIKQQLEDNLRAYLEGNKPLQSIEKGSLDDIKELVWKAETEATIFEVLIQNWYDEMNHMLHNLTSELAWKDKVIFECEQQLESRKQAVEEYENDYATLMSICFALLRDQNDNDSREEPPNIPTHEFGRRKLMELSELLTLRDVPGGQVENDMQFDGQHDSKKSILILDSLDQEMSNNKAQYFSNLSIDQGVKSFVEFQIAEEEEHATQQFRQLLEFEIASEIIMQKYNDALSMGFELNFFPANDYEAVDSIIKKACNNFGDLEERFESFLDLEASMLEKIRSSCSTSITKCELKLDSLTQSLAHQVNETKIKISSVQLAIRELEWRHMVEEDILVWLLCDAFIQKGKNVEDSTHRALNMEIKPSKISENFNFSVDWTETLGSPNIAVGDHQSKSDNETKHFGCSKTLDSPSGIQDKDKLIRLLRADKEDLRKEKATLEQKLDAITEELYSLKRQFWKEKEIWVSKLSQPQRKEVEAQVEALSRHSPRCRDLEEEFKKLQMERFEDLLSDRKKEWNSEKEDLLHIISRKEIEIDNLSAEILRLRDKEHSKIAEQADVLLEFADLKIQVDDLSNAMINKEFQLAKCKELWEVEKVGIKEEVYKVLERERARILSSHCRVTELEAELQRSRTERFQLESTYMIMRKEWENDRMNLREQAAKFLEKEQARAAVQGHSTARITELEAEIKRLCQEKVTAESSLQEVQYERDILREKVDILVQKEHEYSTLEGHLLASMVELEILLDASQLKRLAEEQEFEQELLSEKDSLRGEIANSKKKEGQLLAKVGELEALLEALYLERRTENASFVRFKQEVLSEMDNLREEIENLKVREHAYAVLEGHLVASIAELEVLLEATLIETLSEESSFQRVGQESVDKKDNFTGEVENLKEKEHAYAVLEGHLIALVVELESEIESSRLERHDQNMSTERELSNENEITPTSNNKKFTEGVELSARVGKLEAKSKLPRLIVQDDDSSPQISRLEWETEKNRFRTEIEMLLKKEHLYALSFGHLLGEIVGLEAEIEAERLTKLDQESLLTKFKQEEERLLQKVDELLEIQHAYSLSKDHLLARIKEVENELEMLKVEKLELGSTVLRLQEKYMADKEGFLTMALEKKQMMEKLATLVEKETSHVKIIKQLQSEKDQLVQTLQQRETLERDNSVELTCKERDDKQTRVKKEMQSECLKMELNNKPVDFKTRLDSVLRQLESEFSGQIGQMLQSSQEMENKIMDMIHDRTVRLDEVRKACTFLKCQLRSSTGIEGHYKQRLAKELSNLQKAEAEVDVLGDEVDCLLGILEEVQMAFDFYAPVLHHYPKMTQVAKLVKQEIQLRIDPKYGV